MIFLLVYLYCDIGSGCRSAIHSSHTSKIDCDQMRIEQERHWFANHQIATLTCMEMKGFNKPLQTEESGPWEDYK